MTIRRTQTVRLFSAWVVLLLAVAAFAQSVQPAPTDFSHLIGKPIFGSRTRLTFPAAYDLRALGRVPPMRDQSPLNTCWTFAAYGSLESALLPGESADFSEMHMARTHGFSLKINEGGGQYMALAYLARWSGPVAESDDPYNSAASPPYPVVRKHLQGAAIIPNRSGPLDNGNIKQAVMDYGGVSSTMYQTAAAYNASTGGFYYAGTATGNHSITIVGWDDHYRRTNFLTPPPGDGAFLVRNSYGSGWGKGGYFYMSYYDAVIGKGNMLFYQVESPTNYARNYQYDEYGLTGFTGFGSPSAWFANVFTAASSESLAAVSFYTASPDSVYELAVYLNPTNGPRAAGEPALRQTGSIDMPGYHTVKLNAPVALANGQRFSVVVKMTTPGYNYPIPLEELRSGYTPNATAAPGQSYLSADGVAWTDATSKYAGANVCLKAFTQLRAAQPARVDLLVRGAQETAYLGDGVYTLSGSGQTVQQAVKAGAPTLYYLKVKNQGDSAVRANVLGPIGSGGWRVRYFNEPSGGTEVTAQVSQAATGGWPIPLAPRAEKTFRVEVTATAAVPPGAVQETLVRVATPDNGQADVARLLTEVSGALTGVNLAVSPDTRQTFSHPVTLTATPNGGRKVEYAFQALWKGYRLTLRGYGLANSVVWTPAAPGDYTLIVWAREVGSVRGYDTVTSIPYSVR